MEINGRGGMIGRVRLPATVHNFLTMVQFKLAGQYPLVLKSCDLAIQNHDVYVVPVSPASAKDIQNKLAQYGIVSLIMPNGFLLVEPPLLRDRDPSWPWARSLDALDTF